MIYAFFIFCHHIKDYIINDESFNIEKKIVENYINDYDCLSICADICNGTKHLEFDERHPPRSGGKPQGKLRVKRDDKKGKGLERFYVYFSTTKGDINFLELADCCIQKWIEFIKQNCQECVEHVEYLEKQI